MHFSVYVFKLMTSETVVLTCRNGYEEVKLWFFFSRVGKE